MDLLDLDNEAMYFETSLPDDVQQLLDESGQQYRSQALDGSSEDDLELTSVDSAEWALLRAYLKAPEHLSVIVALYRFFYYRHRYAEAVMMADRAILLSSRQLGLNEDWRQLRQADLERAAQHSMTSTRFLLLALKGAAWLLLRQHQPQAAIERLAPVRAFDQKDQLGTSELLSWAEKAVRREEISNAGGNVHLLGD
ncbi:hypothetical protein U5801_12635 [Lamprobacter modestohalophilus]|uniref:hypothetical protein n=1 Tax=Lamprobacter modestohalophilus TaxID=1064514 RepID=UPI002ADED7CF|nr:hypothetical protein [Lamprobacter modestohalophilus]MEA1050646.1 hypothetical protein [Lamprobacter modestohalophilus]